MKTNQSLRTYQSHAFHTTTRLSVILITLLISIFISSHSTAEDLKLFRTAQNGNTLVLTQRAMIVKVDKSNASTDYTIWQNGRAYISINDKHDVAGVLPPGTYVLRVEPKKSVTIKLSTKIIPQKILLWGRQHKLVKPLYEGNKVVITQASVITKATYDGTDGFSISTVRPNSRSTRVLTFVSPHQRGGNGPRVIGGTGGKTMVGQTLPAGVYMLTPGQGKADGIVYGVVTITVR